MQNVSRLQPIACRKHKICNLHNLPVVSKGLSSCHFAFLVILVLFTWLGYGSNPWGGAKGQGIKAQKRVPDASLAAY